MSDVIIRGEYGRSPRGSFLWMAASNAPTSSSPTTSKTKYARCPSGNQSIGDGGRRNVCSGVHGRYCLLTHQRDHDPRHVSIPCSSQRSGAGERGSPVRVGAASSPARGKTPAGRGGARALRAGGAPSRHPQVARQRPAGGRGPLPGDAPKRATPYTLLVGLRPSLREPPRDATCPARIAFGERRFAPKTRLAFCPTVPSRRLAARRILW